MIIGSVKEIKNHEYRVGLTPGCINAYASKGHRVLMEAGAGTGSGFTDEEYINAGADILTNAKLVWTRSEMIVKVKEPIEPEYKYMREGLILYTFLHLAADKELTKVLLEKEVKAVAYETIEDKNGSLPCLLPMSEIAGKMAVQEGAKYLEKHFGGRGVLLAGVSGIEKGNVVIIGGGVAGLNACKIAVGMGANVTILDISVQRLSYIDDIFYGAVTTLLSTAVNIRNAIARADLVIGAVLVPGKAAPKLIMRDDLKLMKKGAVIVDIAVDQGGCFETTHATTHQDPIFIVDGIVHYCVANIPGAVPRTSTIALTNTTLPYGLMIADHGLEKAAGTDPGLLKGVNCYDGKCTCKGVAEALSMEYYDAACLMNI